MWKRWAGRAACALIIAGAFQLFYFQMLSPRRAAFGRMAAGLPFRKTPGVPELMAGVRERTRDGDRIAIVVPMQKWDGGYAYVYTRSTYLLAGRTTVPLIGPDDRPIPQNLAYADWIAAWHIEPAVPGFEIAWRHPHGVLLRRIR